MVLVAQEIYSQFVTSSLGWWAVDVSGSSWSSQLPFPTPQGPASNSPVLSPSYLTRLCDRSMELARPKITWTFLSSCWLCRCWYHLGSFQKLWITRSAKQVMGLPLISWVWVQNSQHASTEASNSSTIHSDDLGEHPVVDGGDAPPVMPLHGEDCPQDVAKYQSYMCISTTTCINHRIVCIIVSILPCVWHITLHNFIQIFHISYSFLLLYVCISYILLRMTCNANQPPGTGRNVGSRGASPAAFPCWPWTARPRSGAGSTTSWPRGCTPTWAPRT